jgi:hypothetical protein
VLSLADLESVAALNVCLAAGQHEHSMPEETNTIQATNLFIVVL